jgi:hypothetical protein
MSRGLIHPSFLLFAFSISGFSFQLFPGETPKAAPPTPNTPPHSAPPDALPREIPPQTPLDVTLTPCGLEIFFTLSRITYIETTFPID